MKNYFLNSSLIALIGLIVFSCAKRGSIEGGPKDITPPEIVKAIPENFSTNFNQKEIKIYFDEYVKLKDIQKQLIVSPPMNYDPIISPLGAASKQISIKILDTLPENTTYSFNFGQSIVDNNEGNPYSYFKYIFSTGSHIDSLSLNGKILDAEKRNPETFVSVMLYKVDSTFSDSIVYKEKPTYITNTLDSINLFQLNNLKEGKYLLVGLKEESQNFVFNQKTDKIGFYKNFVTVPSDSIYDIKLFKEKIDFKTGKPKSKSKNAVAFGYEGDYKDMKIKHVNSDNEDRHVITKLKDKDSLIYWYRPVSKIDSMEFEITNPPNYKKNYWVKLRKSNNDSLKFSASRGSLKFDEHFKLSSNNPISSYNPKLISIKDKDSTSVAFTHQFDALENVLHLYFDLKEDDKYHIDFLPNAITDFFEEKNDTLTYTLNTSEYKDFGNVTVRLKNAPNENLIVQLTDEQAEVKYEMIGSNDTVFDFLYINPGKYFLRVVVDENKNNRFDSGNYLKKRQPERISYFPKELDVRPNWDLDQEFILNDN